MFRNFGNIISGRLKYVAVEEYEVHVTYTEETESVKIENGIEVMDTVALNDNDNNFGDRLDGVDNLSVWYRMRYQRRSRCGHFTFTQLEKILSLAVALLSFAVFVLIITMTTKSSDLPTVQSASKVESVCSTRECVKVASRIASSLDETVDPCTDFYTFACGGWIKTHSLLPEVPSINPFSEVTDNEMKILKNLIETKPTYGEMTSAELRCHGYYKTCMNITAINDLGAQPLLDFLNELGNLPLLISEWNESMFDFNRTIVLLAQYGHFPFFEIYVDSDALNSSRNIIHVKETELSLPREYYINKTIEKDKNLKAAVSFMTDVGVLLGASHNDSYSQMHDLLEFEQQLAAILPSSVETRDESTNYQLMLLRDLANFTHVVNWTYFVQAMFNGLYNITSDEPIATSAVEFLQRLSPLIDHTPVRTLANYMGWRSVQGMLSFLGKPFLDAQAKFDEILRGVDLDCPIPRWQTCITMMNLGFGSILSKMYVEKNFDINSKVQVEKMVKEIQKAFIQNVIKIEWMDPVTTNKAIEKVNAMKDLIGFSDDILNNTFIKEQYRELDVHADYGYFNNTLNILHFIQKKSLRRLRQPVDRTEWDDSAHTVNALYAPKKNTIEFPAGILQPPFFQKGGPWSVNLGAIGTAIGHELTHGFDDKGLMYDLHGNLKVWWENSTLEKFGLQKSCMEQQYSTFEVAGGMHVNGNLTIGENIADNGGLRLAYKAYQASHNDQFDPLLPSLNYTQDQLFYIGYAQLWCSVQTVEYARLHILKDAHSPNQYRVLGVLRNSQEFSSAFNCPVNSLMNPENKCRVW